MSQIIDLEEKSDFCGEISNSSVHSTGDLVYHLHDQNELPDGGLRAWLVVLGVRFFMTDLLAVMNHISEFMCNFLDVSGSVLNF